MSRGANGPRVTETGIRLQRRFKFRTSRCHWSVGGLARRGARRLAGRRGANGAFWVTDANKLVLNVIEYACFMSVALLRRSCYGKLRRLRS